MKVSQKRGKIAAVLAGGMVLAAGVAQAETIYVDARVNGNDNGSSWSDAYKYLQDALDAASSGYEIRVAEGTYKPDKKSCGTSADCVHDSCPGVNHECRCDDNLCDWDDDEGNPRQQTFHLESGVAIYGGYRGCPLGNCEGNPDLRDIDEYETVLSGDLEGDDGPDFANYDENSLHVVSGGGVDAIAILDGFTVTAGNATEDWGGGMNASGRLLCVGGSEAGEVCAVDDDCDGGTCQASTTVANCTFAKNRSVSDGGAMNAAGALMVTNCEFRDNTTTHGGGGAIRFMAGITATVTECLFTGNHADAFGGAIKGGDGDNWVTVTNSTFTGNTTENWGGAIYICEGHPWTITGCTFTGNDASGSGGAVAFLGGVYTLANCAFTGNKATGNGGAVADFGSVGSTAVNCTFAGNHAGTGGGVYISAAGMGGSIAPTNCILWGNTDGTSQTVEEQQIHDTAELGSVTYSCVQDDDPDDQSVYSGTGNIDDDPDFYDPGAAGTWTAAAVYLADEGQTKFTAENHGHSGINGLFLKPISGMNLDTLIVHYNDDEIFVWGDFAEYSGCPFACNSYVIMDYHPSSGSPVIEAGDNTAVPSGDPRDLDGHPRIYDGKCDDGDVVDMGAYEYQCCDAEHSCAEIDCRTGQYCDAEQGQQGQCVYPKEADGTPCDDELWCTGSDTCSNGVCYHSGDPCPGPDGDGDCSEICNETQDDCSANDPNGSACDDASECTEDDVCNGAGSCVGTDLPQDTTCDLDELYCTDDRCNGSGTCIAGDDPCPGPDGDSNCVESCNEALGDCSAYDPVESPCNDGNVCTDGDCCIADYCAVGCGLGGAYNTDPCDDGNECTYDDVCNGAGTCVGADSPDETPCDDGLFCTLTDECDGNGNCDGSGDRCTHQRAPECCESEDRCYHPGDPPIMCY